MKQRVDLYRGAFRQEPPQLSARRMCALFACAAVVLGLASAWIQVHAWRIERDLAALRAREVEAAEGLGALAASHPPARADAQLEARAARRSAERDAKAQLLQLLAGDSLGNRDGFSGHLSGLARGRVEGVWLREVRIAGGGREIALAGSALRPELVPRMIQSLAGEEPFAGHDFSSLRIERPEDAPARVDFALTTDRGEEKP